MPTKRVRRAPTLRGERSLGLNLRREAILTSGCDFFGWADGAEPAFADDAQRAACWRLHRAAILADWDRPGRRPVCVWELDYRLSRVGWPREWDWGNGILSEAEMVRHLLLAGELEHCRRNGLVPIADEVAEIERQWRHEIAVTLQGRDAGGEITRALPTWGTPPWYFKLHSKRIAAAEQAARERYYAAVGRGGDAA